MECNSGLELVKGASAGELALSVAGGGAGLGALLGKEADKVSDASVAEGAGGREDEVANDKEEDVNMWELVLAGSKEGGISGKLELCKLAEPAGKEALKLGYCIGCGIEGGTDSPGDGRSKVCWCKCGSAFGGA